MPKPSQLSFLAIDSAAPAKPKGKRGGFTSAAPGALPPKADFRVTPPAHPLDAERTRFNADRSHRFTWFRAFQGRNPDDYVAGIGMNPSRACEVYGDATVDRMVVRARDHWDAGGYYQLNALSIRLTASTKLKDFPCINLPENDEWLRRIAAGARFVVVCWGNPGHQQGRGTEVEQLLREVCPPHKVLCFGKNSNGAPTHPLYLPYSAELVPYF